MVGCHIVIHCCGGHNTERNSVIRHGCFVKMVPCLGFLFLDVCRTTEISFCMTSQLACILVVRNRRWRWSGLAGSRVRG